MIPLQVFTLQSANKTIIHADFFRRHGGRSSRTMKAKFWVSLITCTLGPLANNAYKELTLTLACNGLTRYRPNHVTSTHFRCTKSVPITSIYCNVGQHTIVFLYGDLAQARVNVPTRCLGMGTGICAHTIIWHMHGHKYLLQCFVSRLNDLFFVIRNRHNCSACNNDMSVRHS